MLLAMITYTYDSVPTHHDPIPKLDDPIPKLERRMNNT